MGTSWSLKACASHRVAQELGEELEKVFQAVIADLSTWERESFISRFNRAPSGQVLAAPLHFLSVWRRAAEIAGRSSGAFNPCHGAAVRARGHGPGHHDLASFDTQHIWRGDPILRDAGEVCQPGRLELDLSAIAKGYAVDQAAKAIAELGVQSFLVEIGGEFIGRGVRPDGQPWWIEIERASEQAPVVRVALCGWALATSGDLHKMSDAGSHIIRSTGSASDENSLASVSVLSRDCMTADGWATALYSAGGEALGMANDNEIAALFQTDCGGYEVSDALRPWLSD